MCLDQPRNLNNVFAIRLKSRWFCRLHPNVYPKYKLRCQGNGAITKHNPARHQKKKKWIINRDKTNATYGITDAQRKTKCNRRTTFENSVGKLLPTSYCTATLVDVDGKHLERFCTVYALYGNFVTKSSTFLKNRHFIIQERFNELICCVKTIIKCGVWQPVKFLIVSRSWNEMIFIVSLN